MPFFKDLWSLCRAALVGITMMVTLTTCAFSPSPRNLSVKLDPKVFREGLKRLALTDLNCFFVSVSGPGVTFDYGPLNLGTRDPACMGIGRTSDVVSLATLTTTGVKVRTTGGPNRIVRVLGAKTTLTSCDGQPLSALFGSRQPEIFEVGSTVVDAFTDRKVEVVGPATVAKPTDIVKPCDLTGVPAGSGYSPYTASPPSSTRVAVFFRQGAQNIVRIFNVTEAGEIIGPAGQDFPLSSSYLHPFFRLEPFSREFFLTSSENSATAKYRSFVVDGFGNISSSGNYALTNSLDYLDFSVDGKFTYTYSPAALAVFQNRTDFSDLRPMTPSSCPANNGVIRVISTTNTTYMFGPGAASKILRPANGSLCGAGAGGVTFAGSLNGLPKFGYFSKNSSLYTVETVNGVDTIYHYPVEPDGTWMAASDSGHATGGSAEMMLSPDEKFLIYAAKDQNRVVVYPLKPNGTIAGNLSADVPVSSPTSLSVDFLNRMVYVVATNTLMSQFTLRPDGSLIAVPLNFAFVADSLELMQSIPIK